MIYIIIVISLMPITLIMVYSTYRHIRILRGLYITKQYSYISPTDYTTIPLIPINVKMNLGTGEHGLLIFDVTNIYLSQKERMYTGVGVGNIKVPFTNISLSNRKLFNKNNYTPYGESKVVITNVHFSLIGYDNPTDFKYIVREVDSMTLADYGSTVIVYNENYPPCKIKFKNVTEALYFINAIWTIKNNDWRHYRYTDTDAKVYKLYEPKAITKWDIKRLKEECERYPGLKERTWSEVQHTFKTRKTFEKNHQSLESGEKYHTKKVVTKDGKEHSIKMSNRIIDEYTTLEEKK